MKTPPLNLVACCRLGRGGVQRWKSSTLANASLCLWLCSVCACECVCARVRVCVCVCACECVFARV